MKQVTKEKTPSIEYLVFGSPLIDMIADVDNEFIKKYSLNLNETKHVKFSECKVFTEMEKTFEVTFVTGGCSYNTLKVLNWILPDEKKASTCCLGAIGDDTYGIHIQTQLMEQKIKTFFDVNRNGINTGICAVACYERDRSHLTDLGCSNLISEDYIEAVWDEIKEAKVIFTELFILTNRKDTVFKLANLGLDDSKLFGFNLPSFYFIDKFLSEIEELITHVDIMFANEKEAMFLGDLLHIVRNL